MSVTKETELRAFIGKHAIEVAAKAQETKLKGYSKFLFFAFKAGKFWHVCEWTTGREVSTGFNKTLADAKKSARQYLDEHSERDMTKIEAAIATKGIVNENPV
jgi:hypothetical protein